MRIDKSYKKEIKKHGSVLVHGVDGLSRSIDQPINTPHRRRNPSTRYSPVNDPEMKNRLITVSV